MPTILVIDDDRRINEFITIALEQEGFHVISALDGEEGLSIIEKNTIDLIVLDIMMPKVDGWEVASYLQQLNLDLPVLMLSAKGQLEDKLQGFKLGIADYLQKPFLIEELVARIHAILSRYQKGIEEKQVIGNTTLDSGAAQLVVAGVSHNLPKKELKLLQYFWQHTGQVLSREQVLNQVWGLDFEGDGRTLDVHVKRLRDKLISSDLQITSVRGLGYKLEEHVDEKN
ncbi:response regulator transcription factor [Vagococcus fessus]|uniref:Heme response regulator HssR n=1 Tax=Vagococcus fessus TaxID=120370 RepID=A0A430A7D4_9ENTE|nr:response regulator transcription factor [Vagococcus fessus]RSU03018.1 hypothetical protein CBF31_04635 [Vagococcus fessus]